MTTTPEYFARLPSEKKKRIRRRDLAIFELDTALDTLDSPDKKELLNFIRSLTNDHDVAIYTEDREKLETTLPKDLLAYVRQAPDSFELYGSRSQTDKHFYDFVLENRKPEEAILFANKSRFIYRASGLGILTVFMPWGKESMTGSANYAVANIRQLRSFVGRKL